MSMVTDFKRFGNENKSFRIFSFCFQDIDELIYRLEELKQQNHYGNYIKKNVDSNTKNAVVLLKCTQHARYFLQ